MRVFVTGGAGYIGSHAVKALLARGHTITVLDNLSTGHREAIDPRAEFIHTDLFDPELPNHLKGHDAVLHFAALSIVSDSCTQPLAYWWNNVAGSIALLRAIKAAEVPRLIFSSTAATYGLPDTSPIVESTPQHPINPYGATKLAIERAILDYTTESFGFAILRYFNVGGCAWGLGEAHSPETHLIPIVLQTALGQRQSVSIFGADYPTPDGTCVRDYVHVKDLVDAHIVVLDALETGDQRFYNIGSGRGWSVREVMEVAREVTGVSFEVREGARRAGDPPSLVTDPSKIKAELGWSTQHSSLQTILEDHWEWMRSHPDGYPECSSM